MVTLQKLFQTVNLLNEIQALYMSTAFAVLKLLREIPSQMTFLPPLYCLLFSFGEDPREPNLVFLHVALKFHMCASLMTYVCHGTPIT